MTLDEELQSIYATLPAMAPGKCEEQCRSGRCYKNECCTVTACSRREKHNINRYIKERNLGLPFIAMPFGGGYILPNTCGLERYDFEHIDVRCEYLKAGRCAIYEVRPAICRLFGACKELPCTYFPEESKGSFVNRELERVGLFPHGFFDQNRETIEADFHRLQKRWYAEAQQKINKLIHKK